MYCVPQERTGVKMIMIQDDPMPTGSDKPLRITGDPYKVQVRLFNHIKTPIYLQRTRRMNLKFLKPSTTIGRWW